MRLCVTMSRGMEPFVRYQLEQIPELEINESVEGKILFEAEISCETVDSLRCVERLFLVAAYERLICSWNKRQLLDKLYNLCGDISWNSLSEKALCWLLQNGQTEKTFRVSLKATGKWRRKIDIEKLSTNIARHIKRVIGFSSSLRCPLMDICIHLTEKNIFIGVQLTRKPLSRRPYLKHNALRSTVVDAMLSMANIQDGDVIMDLTCGSSSILLQAAHDFHDRIILLGADISWNALQLSLENMDYLRKIDSIEPLFELLFMDIYNDCFKYAAVDHIVSDLPFGKQYGTNECSLRILQRVCDIFSKCWSASDNSVSTAVLLISETHLVSISSMLKLPTRLKHSYPISLGTTQAVIVLLANDSPKS